MKRKVFLAEKYCYEKERVYFVAICCFNVIII